MAKTVAAGDNRGEVRKLLSLIRNEYLEMPGLCLTGPQAHRLWHADPALCDAVLSELVETAFLKRSKSGQYLRLRR